MAEPNIYEVGALKFWALGDRILIKEDEFRTGYECATCEGKGYVTCTTCAGSKHYSIEGHDRTCTACNEGGQVLCPTCEGKGGLIVAPEISQRRPTTGQIVSCGADVKNLKLGESVLYSNFAGYVVDLDRAGVKVTLRILHETEILCGMEGHLTLKGLKSKQDIAVFNG
jgi:co-chaperonin GroES (HSP10)